MSQRLERLRRKRDGYARYAEIVHAQLEALNADDMDAFARLAVVRDALAVRIDSGEEIETESVPRGESAGHDHAAGLRGGGAALDRAEGPETAARLLTEARHHLEMCLERDEQLRLRLRAMREETREAIQELDVRGSQLGRYLQTGTGGSTRLDIRL